jgi:lysyl-tRNA synthetase class 2
MTHWQPSATLKTLQQRAKIIEKIRHFFVSRGILEVDTPLLSHASVTDPHVVGIPAIYKEIGSKKEKIVYLQTSPEYAMKRLLAAGSGAIFQIGKAFRQGDLGSIHNPEFTMLEWYQPGFDHHALMDEMDLLLQNVLVCEAAERISYAQLFQKYVDINPHTATLDELKKCIQKAKINFAGELSESNDCLHLLLTHLIEPHIGRERPLFLYDFPMTQAALAKIRYEENPPVASRFEVYFKGVELANGFHELQDAKEQRKRFENELMSRKEMNLPLVPIDEYFLAALEYGLPDCAGVALGVDRLIMLATEKQTLKDVMSFAFERA